MTRSSSPTRFRATATTRVRRGRTVSGDTTTFAGAGSETNNGRLSTFTYGSSGNTPGKDDVSNVYAISHRGAAVNEVFFGGERIVNNGDSHMDFEFLQSERLHFEPVCRRHLDRPPHAARLAALDRLHERRHARRRPALLLVVQRHRSRGPRLRHEQGQHGLRPGSQWQPREGRPAVCPRPVAERRRHRRVVRRQLGEHADHVWRLGLP